MSTVEIILPFYNGLKWLDEAVQSILEQSFTNWHLTIVDDASPVSCTSYLGSLQNEFQDKISLIKRHECGGAATARMDAIGKTQSKYIAFIDQDDLWYKDKLEAQIQLLVEDPSIRAVHSNIEIIDEFSHIKENAADLENAARDLLEFGSMSSEELSQSIFDRNSIRIISSLINREAFIAVGGFDIDLSGGEDWEFWVRFTHGYRVGHVSKPLIKRRVHDGNTSKIKRYERTCGQLVALGKIKLAFPNIINTVSKRNMIEKKIEHLLQSSKQ